MDTTKTQIEEAAAAKAAWDKQVASLDANNTITQAKIELDKRSFMLRMLRDDASRQRFIATLTAFDARTVTNKVEESTVAQSMALCKQEWSDENIAQLIESVEAEVAILQANYDALAKAAK